MAEMPPTEWARPPRSLAVEANDCFMVRIPRGSNRIQGRGAMLRAEWQAPLGFVLETLAHSTASACRCDGGRFWRRGADRRQGIGHGEGTGGRAATQVTVVRIVASSRRRGSQPEA